jgi:hypothetical protein
MVDYSHFNSIDFDILLDDLANDPEFFGNYENLENMFENEYLHSDSSDSESHNANENSDDTDQSIFCKNGRKRKLRLPALRIVKTDVRLSYAQMFGSVWNGMEFHMIYGFMDSYCSQEFSMSDQRTIAGTEETNIVSIASYETFAKFLFILLKLMPDTVLQIVDTKYFMSIDNTRNKIECTFEINATQIFENSDKFFGIYTSKAFPMKSSNKSIEHSIKSFERATNNLTKDSVLLREPISLLTQGTITFHLNEINQVFFAFCSHF